MDRNFETALKIADLLYKRSQKIEGPEESISMSAPSVIQEPVQQPLIGHLDIRTSERSSEISAAMRHAGHH